jgi:hypothetical protein
VDNFSFFWGGVEKGFGLKPKNQAILDWTSKKLNQQPSKCRTNKWTMEVATEKIAVAYQIA